MRAGTLLLLLLCGACRLDFSGVALCLSSCPERPGGGGGGGGGSGAPRLAFRVHPSSVSEGEAITPAVEVELRDLAGNVIPHATDSVIIRISFNPGAGTLAGATTVAAVGGVATFSNLRVDNRGEGYTLRVAAAGYGSAVSSPFNVLGSVEAYAPAAEP